MNHIPSSFSSSSEVLLRKSAIYRTLEEICQDLELSDTQYESAKKSYEAVAEWLSASENPLLKYIKVYAHGSAGLGTTVRPINRDDFDVDLICLVMEFSAHRSPAELKRIVGDRLRQNACYAAMLEEKKRCWRLNYAREFHLDISPTIPNLRCTRGGELVPDKQLRQFKPTNPKGYRKLFEKRALLVPRVRLQKSTVYAGQRANVDPFPEPRRIKGVLRRTVQLLKRHRDIAFLKVEADVAPISIIITTLAARSYEMCVSNFTFDSELDVLVATIRMMPHFIERPLVGGKKIYLIPNETTEGENFAERWNTEPERAKAFYAWHAQALADFEEFASLEGLDVVTGKLEKSLGSVVRRVTDAQTESISKARVSQSLYVAPAVGLTLTKSAQATPVPRNTHFGD